MKMPVTDGDEPHTQVWSTKYKIIEGNNDGFFNVTTGPSKLEGIIRTAKVKIHVLETKHLNRTSESASAPNFFTL